MNWLLLTIFAILSRATFGVLTKVLSSKVNATNKAHSFLQMLFATPLAIIAGLFLGGVSFDGLSSVWVITLVMLVSLAFANVLYYKGMEFVDAGTSQVAFSSILIWGTLLSVIFLKSNFSIIQFFGILLLLFAIILAQYKAKTFIPNKGVIYIALSTILFAIFQVTSAEISQSLSTGGYLLIAYLGSTFILGLVYFSTIKDDFTKLNGSIVKTSRISIITSSFSVLYFIFAFLAYRVAPDPGIVIILLTSQALVAVILGIIFLRERENMNKKLIAGALALLGGFLITG